MLSALKTKRVRAGLGLLALLAFAGAAVAYFSTSGSGTGSASVGTGTPVSITATISPPAGGLVPGGPPASVSFQVANPGGAGNQEVNTVSLPAGGVQAFSPSDHTTNITGTGAGQCDTSQFSMADVPESVNVGDGQTVGLPHNGSLYFHDSGSPQDGCKGAYLVATFTSN